MDHLALRDIDFDTDLESGGGTTSEEDSSKDPVSGSKETNMSVTGEGRITLCSNVSKFSGVFVENAMELADKKLEGQETCVVVEKKLAKEKRKKMSAKKPPKPPRPPRGPSLDAADQKLIREINELAMLKRARIERMKALKKTKAAKASSSNSNLFAMLFTILFCLVIVFQGMSTRRSPVGFHGSPESAMGTEGLISIQYYKNSSAAGMSDPYSGSPSFVEQVSGLDPKKL